MWPPTNRFLFLLLYLRVASLYLEVPLLVREDEDLKLNTLFFYDTEGDSTPSTKETETYNIINSKYS